LGIKRFALETIGRFLFLNVADEPITIVEQFSSDLLDSLESLSRSFDDEVLVARYTGRYNWKLAYENLRDGLHPRFVHTQSLNREVRFQAPISEELRTHASSEQICLSRLSFGGAEGEFVAPRSLPFHESVDRWGVTDAYFNWLLYPNTHVVCPDGGYSFSIEHHEPVSPQVTDVILYFLTARRRRPFTGASAVLWEYAKAAKAILKEDSAVMEEVQAGLAAARGSVTQGDYELQNRITDRWYLNALSADDSELQAECS
jgi:carnitine monooxygenase subunit